MAWLVHLTAGRTGLPVDRATGLLDGVALRRALLPVAAGGRLLFRVETAAEAGAELLVQSDRPPAPAAVRPFATARGRPRELAADLAALTAGSVVRYRIAANPVRRNGSAADAERRDRLTVLRGAAADDWWQARAVAAGLRPLTGTATTAADLVGAHGLRHGVTRFDGTAEVTDPVLLRTSVLTGIGRARNYGCGLLTVTRTN